MFHKPVYINNAGIHTVSSVCVIIGQFSSRRPPAQVIPENGIERNPLLDTYSRNSMLCVDARCMHGITTRVTLRAVYFACTLWDVVFCS